MQKQGSLDIENHEEPTTSNIPRLTCTKAISEPIKLFMCKRSKAAKETTCHYVRIIDPFQQIRIPGSVSCLLVLDPD